MGPRRPILILIWLGLVLVAATVGCTALVLMDLREEALADSRRQLRNMALVLSQETDQTFQSLALVEMSLIDRMRAEGIGSGEDYRRRMSEEATQARLHDATRGLPYVDALGLVDARGRLINFSRSWPVPDIDVSDRDYFQALRADRTLDPFVSVPVASRADGEWTIFVARPFSGSDGEFLGLVLGAMQLARFERFYSRIALDADSSTALFRTDGILLARYPRADPSIGRSFRSGGYYDEVLSSLDGDAVPIVSRIDGQERLAAGHSVAHFPLVVVASTTMTAALAHWREQALYTVLLVGVAIVLISLSVGVAVVMTSRHMRSLEMLARADAEKTDALHARAVAEAEHEADRKRMSLERQLQHFHKMEALGTLAGGVAHDLNNTLVPIIALTKLAAGRLPEQSRERENLGTVLQAAERARDLVRQIVAFSREEAVEKQVVGVADIIRNAVTMLRATLPATVRIDTQIEAAPPIVADAGQIHQIIVNLMTNSAHAIGADLGTITIGLASESHDDGREWVCLWVADTGCGIEQAVLDRIFEPFFTTKPVGEGTGLGLSVVHGIVAEHGGRIAVKSTVGKGTRFDILLPAAALQDESPAAHPPNRMAS